MARSTREQRLRYVSVAGRAAMQQYGFGALPLGQPGSPTPGRVADALADLAEALREGIEHNDLAAIRAAYQDLDELRLALDAWGIAMTQQMTHQDRQVGSPLPEKP